MRLTPSQILAGLTLAGMTQEHLAEITGLNYTALNRTLQGNGTARESTLKKIRAAIEARGIEFTENEGVKRKAAGIEIFEGQDRFNDFMAYHLEYLKIHGGDVCVSLNDERDFQAHLTNAESFRRDMVALDAEGRIRGRILAVEGNFIRTWADLRRARKAAQNIPVSFCVFGDNFALISFARKHEPYVELHKNSLFAADFTRLFDILWEGADTP